MSRLLVEMVEAIGLLMWEHRLIEQIVPSLREESYRVEQTGKVDSSYVDKAFDFFRVYTDKTHHGKEEDILFKELEKKKLNQEHIRIMNELKNEHTTARNKVKALIEANKKYKDGDKAQGSVVVGLFRDLAELYPKHIEKEDKHFFMPIMKYFSNDEKVMLLKRFEEFDMAMIHWKYQQIILGLTGELIPIRNQV